MVTWPLKAKYRIKNFKVLKDGTKVAYTAGTFSSKSSNATKKGGNEKKLVPRRRAYGPW